MIIVGLHSTVKFDVVQISRGHLYNTSLFQSAAAIPPQFVSEPCCCSGYVFWTGVSPCPWWQSSIYVWPHTQHLDKTTPIAPYTMLTRHERKAHTAKKIDQHWLGGKLTNCILFIFSGKFIKMLKFLQGVPTLLQLIADSTQTSILFQNIVLTKVNIKPFLVKKTLWWFAWFVVWVGSLGSFSMDFKQLVAVEAQQQGVAGMLWYIAVQYQMIAKRRKYCMNNNSPSLKKKPPMVTYQSENIDEFCKTKVLSRYRNILLIIICNQKEIDMWGTCHGETEQ